MTKLEFLRALNERLMQLPQAERRRQCEYYSEMLDDMIEDGADEYEAVAGLGSVAEIAERILQETPLPMLVRSRVKPEGGWTALTIVLLVIGSPIWLPIVLALIAVALSVYLVLWVLIVSVFAVVLSIAVTGAFLMLSPVFAVFATVWLTTAAVGGGILLAGLSILAFLAALAIAKVLVKATVSFAKWIKSLFIKRRRYDE